MTSPVPVCTRKTLSCSVLLAALAFTLSLAPTAHAAGILTDGGFESAIGGNTYSAGSSIDGFFTVTKGSVYIDTQDPFVYDGNNTLNLTGINPYTANTVSQVLATLIGQTYSINFFANADSANTFSIMTNGINVSGSPTTIANNGFPNQSGSNSALFTSYFGQFTATSATTTLSLSANSNPALGSAFGSVAIDDISVQAVATTPEPGSIILVLTGLMGLGQAARQRLKIKSA